MQYKRSYQVVWAFLLCVHLLGAKMGFADKFSETLMQNASKGSPEEVLLTVVDTFMTEQEIADRDEENRQEIGGRDDDADKVIDILVREKGAVPVLIGKAGVGKTSTVARAVQKIIDGQYPDEESFKEVFDNSVWVSTKPGLLMKLVKTNNPAGRMAGINALFESIIALEEKYEKKIVLYLDETHSLDSDQIEAMLPYLDDNRKGIRLVGSTNSDKFQLAFKDNDAFLRRVFLVGLEELSEAETLSILKEWWIPHLEAKHRVKFTNPAKEAVVRIAQTMVPEEGRFGASIKTFDDIAINMLRRKHNIALAAEEQVDQEDNEDDVEVGSQSEEEENENAEEAAETQEAEADEKTVDKIEMIGDMIRIKETEVYNFFTERTGYPVNPFDSAALLAYIDKLKDDLNREIIDQPRMVSDIVELYQDVMMGSDRGLAVSVAVGPTGTGKSEVGLMLAKYAYNNPDSLLRIDANEYKTGGHAMSKLFGAEGGLVTSDTRAGILCDYFDDPAKGKYGGVILIDEGERAHEDFWERLMEFFDNGYFVGGDGRARYARNHIVVITSNRGDHILFPEKSNQWTAGELQARVEEISSDEIKNLFRRKVSGKDEYNIPTPILNRVDLFTVAGPITMETSQKIVRKVVDHFQEKTNEEFHVHFDVSDELQDYLGTLDFNLRDGARPIIRKASRLLKTARNQALSKRKFKRKSKATLELDMNEENQYFIRVDVPEQEPLYIDLPKRKIRDPLKDKEMRDRLRGLNAEIKKFIVGQDMAVDSLSRAVIGHLGSPNEDSTKPLSLFLCGLTGTGKTELGKALARAMYDSADRTAVIPLGHISSESQFNKIFGSDPGFIGSDQERAFEEALRNNPEGGVLVFDEASNMGGNSPELKEAFFKKFYNLIEEGKWTSAATNHTYELGKWVFLFTGNDGEDLFRGVSADELRMRIWMENNDRENIRSILRKAGIPEAFIGRLADTILMKPLMREEVLKIATDRLHPIIVQAVKGREIEVKYDENFLQAFAEAFFRTDMGARSLRTVAEDRVRGLLTEALLQLDYDPTEEFRPELTLTLEDNKINRPFSERDDPERKVYIKVVGENAQGEAITVSEDLTEYAEPFNGLPKEQAIKTAVHEAGHAVVNDPRQTGQRLRHVTIIAGKGYLGYAGYEDIPNQTVGVSDRTEVKYRLARLLAGQIATVMAGYPADSGWSNDLERARGLATKYLLEWGMSGTFEGVSVDKKGNAILTDEQRTQLNGEVQELLDEAKVLARDIMAEKWPLVRKVVTELTTNGFISGDNFDELIEQFEAKTEQWAQSAETPEDMSCAGLLAAHGGDESIPVN